MNLGLKGKRALVTGSTAGIGYAISKQLAEEGAHVIINGRKQTSVNKAAENLQHETGNENVYGIAADFGKREEIKKLIEQVETPDILVNNVGIFENVDFENITDDEWFEMFEVNVMSGIRLSRYYFPKMMDRGEGRIIFISSESALNIPTEMIHYGMTKTAQLAVSRGLARLTKGQNDVTVNAILPGPTASRSLEENMREESEETGKPIDQLKQEFLHNNRPTSLIQRFADPSEVANLVAYVASPLSSATNGAALRVDGGVVNSII